MGTRTFETLRGRVVAGTLVLALLFCHGVFGAMHLSHDLLAAAQEVESGAHANHHGVHETLAERDDGGSAAHHGSGMAPEYFAVFLALFFGSVFLLLRQKMRVFGRGVAFRSNILARTKDLRPPARGPTLSYLQVFRL